MKAALAALASLATSGSTRYRVSVEQGVDLPKSARNLECAGDAWMAPMDSGSVAVFEMDKSDLPQLTARLLPKWKASESVWGRCGPANPQYRTAPRSWMQEKALLAQSGPSMRGDEVDLGVWRIDDTRVGVCLYTDWN